MGKRNIAGGLHNFEIKLIESNGRWAFKISSFYGESKNVIIPASIDGIPVTAIGYDAFSYCKRLTRVLLPESINSIDEYAFYGSYNLTEINVNAQNATYASKEGVLFDKNFTTLIRYPPGKRGEYIVPDTVIGTDSSAFDGCNELTLITFPKSLMKEPFMGECEKLKCITVHENNPMFRSIDGVLFHKPAWALLLYPQAKDATDYIVPERTVYIMCNAFRNCKHLVKIKFNDGLKHIHDNAFSGCVSLTSITLPMDISYIGKCAFKDCSHLESIKLSRKTKMHCHYKAFSDFSGQIMYLD